MRVLYAAGAVVSDAIGSEIVSDDRVIALAESAKADEWPEVWKMLRRVWHTLSPKTQERLGAFDDVQKVLGRMPTSGEIDTLLTLQLAARQDVHLGTIIATVPRAGLISTDWKKTLPALYDAVLAWTKTVGPTTRKVVVVEGSSFRKELEKMGANKEVIELLMKVAAPPEGFGGDKTGALYEPKAGEDEEAVAARKSKDEEAVGQVEVLSEHAAGNDELYKRLLAQIAALTVDQFKMWLVQQVGPAFASLLVDAKTLDATNVGIAKAINSVCDGLRRQGLSHEEVADLRARLENHGRGFGAYAWLSSAVGRQDLAAGQILDALLQASPEDVVRIRKDKALMGRLGSVMMGASREKRERYAILIGDTSALAEWNEKGAEEALDLVTLEPEYWALRIEMALEVPDGKLSVGEAERSRKLMTELRSIQRVVAENEAKAKTKKAGDQEETKDTRKAGDPEPFERKAFLVAIIKALASRTKAADAFYALNREAYDGLSEGECVVDASMAVSEALAKNDKVALANSWKELTGKALLEQWTNFEQIEGVLWQRAGILKELAKLRAEAGDGRADIDKQIGALELRLHECDLAIATWSLDVSARHQSDIVRALPTAEAVEAINAARMHILETARTDPEFSKALKEAGVVLDENQLVDLGAKALGDERALKKSGSGVFDINSDSRRNAEEQGVMTNATHRGKEGLEANLGAQEAEKKSLEKLEASRKAYLATTQSVFNWTLAWVTGGKSLIAKLFAKLVQQGLAKMQQGAAFDRNKANRELLLTALGPVTESITGLLQGVTGAAIWSWASAALGGDSVVVARLKKEFDERIKKAVGDVAKQTIIEQQALTEALRQQLLESLKKEFASWLELATNDQVKALVDRLAAEAGIEEEKEKKAEEEGDYEELAKQKVGGMLKDKVSETGEGLVGKGVDAVLGEDPEEVALTEEEPETGELASRFLPSTPIAVVAALARRGLHILGEDRLAYAAKIGGMKQAEALETLDRLYGEAVLTGTDPKLLGLVGLEDPKILDAWLEHARGLRKGMTFLEVRRAVYAFFEARKKEAAEFDMKSREYHQFPVGVYHGGGQKTGKNKAKQGGEDGRTEIPDITKEEPIEIPDKVLLDLDDRDY